MDEDTYQSPITRSRAKISKSTALLLANALILSHFDMDQNDAKEE